MEILSQIQVGASEAFSFISFFLPLRSTSRQREERIKSSPDQTEKANERERERKGDRRAGKVVQ